MSERDRLVDARDRMARAAGQDDPSAVRLLREAIDLDPALREAYVALGRLYYRNAWLEAELDLWLQRIGVDPTDSDAYERIGWILWFTGRAEESLPWLERNLALRPSGKWGRFYMGNANLILGRYAEAERAYRAAIEAQPDLSSAHAGLAWTLFAAGRIDEARAQCGRMRFDEPRRRSLRRENGGPRFVFWRSKHRCRAGASRSAGGPEGMAGPLLATRDERDHHSGRGTYRSRQQRSGCRTRGE